MATFYLDDATGSDADNGTSEALAWQTLAHAASQIGPGDLLNVKNTNDYTITSAVAWADANILVRGYTATPGDSGRFVVKTSTDSIGLFNIGASGCVFRNVELKHQASTRGIGIYTSGGDRTGLTLQNFRIEGCSRGIDSDFVTNFEFYSTQLENGEIVDCTVYGIVMRSSLQCSNVLFRGIDDTAVRLLPNANGNSHIFNRCQFYDNANYAIRHVGAIPGSILSLNECVVRASGSHGVYFDGGTPSFLAKNSIIYGNGGKGFEAGAALVHFIRNCAFGSNTSGNYNTTYFTANNISGEITLTADPHDNEGSNDFSLNSTAGGGALLRAAGFSPTWGGASYHDVGGVQHQDAGGAGGSLLRPVAMSGGLV